MYQRASHNCDINDDDKDNNSGDLNYYGDELYQMTTMTIINFIGRIVSNDDDNN
jgi:hypothetical protein